MLPKNPWWMRSNTPGWPSATVDMAAMVLAQKIFDQRSAGVAGMNGHILLNEISSILKRRNALTVPGEVRMACCLAEFVL